MPNVDRGLLLEPLELITPLYGSLALSFSSSAVRLGARYILISVSAYHPLGFCFSNLFSFPLPPPPFVTASQDVQGNF